MAWYELFYMKYCNSISILACILQVYIVYYFSGMYKAQGDLWFNGVSLYYILQVNEFTLPQIASLIYGNPFILTIGTISAIIIQIAFPFLILNNWARGITVIIMVMFHLGIMVMMGLFSFGLTMIFLDALILNDNYYRRFYNRLRNLLNTFKEKKEKRVAAKSVS